MKYLKCTIKVKAAATKHNIDKKKLKITTSIGSKEEAF